MAEQDSDVSLSDDDDGMTEEEKAKAFREEVESIIKISVKDQAIYKCIISELEQVRTAHSQRPVVLNQEVVRTLINLPFYSDSGVKDDLLKYGNKLEEVLERYEPLLRSLNRNKEAQLQGIDAITGPFKELINNDSFNPEDWFTEEKVNSVTGTLRSHRLVDQVKAVEVLKDIQKAIISREESHKDFSAVAATEPSSMEESTSSSSQTTNTKTETSTVSSSLEPMETTTSTTTDPVPLTGGAGSLSSTRSSDPLEICLTGQLSEVEGMNDEPCPQLSESTEYTSKQFRGTFTNAGGTLKTYFTDDQLVIPQGAIPEGESYNIWGVVHASLDGYADYVDKKSGERLMAPVNEFCVEGNKHFLIPIQVVVHHGARLEELNKINVALREDNGEIIPVLPELQKVEGKPWFKIDEKVIIIHTHQLCEVLCKVHCEGQEVEGTLRGTLYGKVFKRGDVYYAHFEFYMQFCRSVQYLTAMTESLRNFKTLAGFTFVDTMEFGVLPDIISPDDKLLVEFVFTVGAEDWTRCSDAGNELKQEFSVGSKLPCLKLFDNPKCISQYILQSTSSKPTFPMLFNLRAKILHETSNDCQLEMNLTVPFPFGKRMSTADAELHGTTAAVASGLSEDKLYEIAAAMDPSNWYRVGVSLGVPSKTIDKIIADNPNNMEKQIFKMLCAWYNMQPTDVSRAEAKLKTVLNKFKNQEAMHILEHATEDEDVQSMELATPNDQS